MDDEESLVGQRRVKSPLSQTEKIVIGFCLGFIGVLLFIMMISVLSISSSMPESTPTSAMSSDSHTKPMLDRSTLPQCQPPVSPSRKIAGHKPVLLRNAKLLIGDLDGTERFGFDLLMVDGKIKQIAKGITAPPDSIIIDTKNAFVSPGIVDMHSHAGVDSFPDTFGTRDVNEATSPATPGIRVIDAYNPHDPALTDIVKGGVTTIQVLPGSANTMGGQGAVFKVWPRSSGRASLEHAHVPTADVRLKMACGENPKRVYGRSRHQTPASRMGSAWVMRMKLAEAAKLKREQDKWCAVTDVDNHDDYPTDLTLEPLVQLLRGHGVLNVHCYKTVDMNMMLRLKEEFNFRIASFHHAHESFELAARLARENITAALFADNYAYKMEASEGRADAPVILDAAGARVAIKSDHPVLDAGNMMMQASVAAHFGLPQARALAAVTSVPADAIGLGASLGTLSEGKHADVVVWDRHPLATGARPTKVFIEGVEVVTAPKDELPADTSALDEPPQPPKFNGTQFQKAIQTQLCGQTPQALWLRNARLFSMQDVNSTNDGKIGSVVVGSDGKVMCVEFGQNACTAMGVNALKVDLDDDEYFIVPAWINADAQTRLGDEILSEATGVDGEAGDDGIATVNSMERWKVSLANGGYRGSTRVARNLVADGMLSAVRAPAYLGVAGGVGSLMRVGDGWFGEELKLDGDGLLLDENVGLHVQIGADAKRAGSIENAVSGQLTLLETALSNSTAAAALGADRGVFVRAHHADDILAVLRLAKRLPAYRFVLVGGAEAHLVATQLADANMPAVLSPARCRRQSFDRMRCEHDRVRALVAAGVKLSFSMPSADELRGTRMRVGHEWQRGRLSERQALAGLTSNVADTYKLTDGSGRIAEGESARLVVFHRHPLLSGSRVALAVDRRRRVCAPGEAPFIGFENYKGVV